MYVAYIVKLVFPDQPEKESSIAVREENLFSNKDELIKVISDRFLEAIAKGDT